MADKHAFGANRSRLLRDVLGNRAGWYLGSTRGKTRLSYLMVKDYHDECELGPWVCINPLQGEPKRMLNLALRKIGQVSAEVSCLGENEVTLRLMKDEGFRTLREGYRMFYGSRAHIGNDRAQYAAGFP